MSVVGSLAEFAVAVREKGLPPELREDCSARLLDVLGNSIAAVEVPAARAVSALVSEWGGKPAATAIGTGTRLPEPSAALVNGTLAHSLDFDDTHLPSVLHPSASVVPAALAAAEAHGASGAVLLDAIGVGVETTVRLGMAGYDSELGNSVFFENGQHATAMCGAIGAALASGLVAGLPAARLADAMGIAASMASGLLEANRTGGTVKRVHCGWAAHSGVIAAGMARAGVTGPPTVIEGRFGFLRAFCGDRGDASVIVAGLGESWELPGIFYKPYPCNHFTHAGIDAALRVRAAGVAVEDIERLELGVASAAFRTVGEPAEAKARPESGYHAAFSGPYTVAAALLGGGGLGVGHADFTDAAAADAGRLELAGRVRCYPDPWCDSIFPHQFPAVLRVFLRGGDVIEERVATNRGGPANPLSRQELVAKFRMNVGERVDASRVVAAVAGIEAAASVDGITELLAWPSGESERE